MGTDLDRIEKRTVRYWFEDGIYEMAFGGLEIVLGAYGWLFAVIPKGIAWRTAWFAGMLPLVWGCARLFLDRIKPLKERYTFPRTGFVSYRRPERRKFGLSKPGLIFGIVGALAFSLLREIPERFGILALPSIAGLYGAGISIWIAVKTGLGRRYWQGGVCLLAGIGLSLLPLAEMAALGAFFGIVGLSGIFLGGLAFLRFIGQHPKPGEDAS